MGGGSKGSNKELHEMMSVAVRGSVAIVAILRLVASEATAHDAQGISNRHHFFCKNRVGKFDFSSSFWFAIGL